MNPACIRLPAVCVIAAALGTARAGFPPDAAFYPAAEDPVIEGSFSSRAEFIAANKVRDMWDAGDFYKQHRPNWRVGDITYHNTMTFFNTHHFTEPGYGQLDLYDMNSWRLRWGNTTVEAWIFLGGNNPDEFDNLWLDMSGIGNANYPAGINDEPGFLVRRNDDPSTDRFWRPGMPEPGDPGWRFGDFYGMFCRGGFDDSAFVHGYSDIADPRENYEFSFTMSQVEIDGNGGVPGVPRFGPGGGEDNPLAPGVCDPIWEFFFHYVEVNDWKPSMGGWGQIGGIGYIPVGGEWVLMGWDASMHPTPAPGVIGALVLGLGVAARRRRA